MVCRLDRRLWTPRPEPKAPLAVRPELDQLLLQCQARLAQPRELQEFHWTMNFVGQEFLTDEKPDPQLP